MDLINLKIDVVVSQQRVKDVTAKVEAAYQKALQEAADAALERAKNLEIIPTQGKAVEAWLKAYAAAETDEERWALLDW